MLEIELIDVLTKKYCFLFAYFYLPMRLRSNTFVFWSILLWNCSM